MERAKKRIVSIDALRGVAVLLMMEQHLGTWFLRRPPGGFQLHRDFGMIAFNALGGEAAPLFLTLAGIGSVLAGPSRARRVFAVRGFCVLLFGYAMSALTPGWFSMGSWFILHMIGFCMITTPLWRRLSDKMLWALSTVVLVASVLAQHWLHTPRILTNELMRAYSSVGGFFRLMWVEAHFPVLPWLAMYLIGIIVGRTFPNRLNQMTRIGAALLATGALLLVTGYLSGAYYLRFSFFPLTPPLFMALSGLSVLLVRGALALEKNYPVTKDNYWLICLGRASLTLLVLHVVVFRQYSTYLGLWHALPLWPAFAVLCVVIAALAWLSTVWSKTQYRYGLEWVLRRLS